MTKKIILVRGHSGSGKSTTADLIEQLSQGKAMRIESDMFRTTVDGEYKFEGKEASEKCIKDCYDTVKLMLAKGHPWYKRLEVVKNIDGRLCFKIQVKYNTVPLS